MLKIMQDNLGQEKNEVGNKNIGENHKMISCVSIYLSEEEKKDWKAVFKKLLVIDNNESDEIDIEKLIHLIMRLNDSTISYWWRGGMTLDRFETEFKKKILIPKFQGQFNKSFL